MKRIICVIFIFGVASGDIFPQKKLSESEATALIQKMMEQTATIATLQCAFVQEKTSTLMREKAVAKGKMLYRSPSCLRWEYIDPEPMAMILSGNAAALLDRNGKKTGSEKMLKQLGNIMISMINGNGIANNKQFIPAFYDPDDGRMQLLIILTPVQKRMKELYENIELKIDRTTLLANEIVLNEKSGDKTVISLTDKILNSEISPDNFMTE